MQTMSPPVVEFVRYAKRLSKNSNLFPSLSVDSRMRTLALFGLIFITSSALVSAQNHRRTGKDVEKDIEQAFKSAYSNRSEEIGEFFNKTFAPGGDAEKIGHRFQKAWKGASEGVRQFVNETYWNISKTMKGEDAFGPAATLANISALVAKHIEKSGKKSHPGTEKTTDEKQTSPEHESVLDTAWNYFRSVFGVSTKGEPPVAGAAMTAPVHSSGGLTLGVFTLLAGVLLLVQAGLNRNSWINKPVDESLPRRKPEVPSGYVRIV